MCSVVSDSLQPCGLGPLSFSVHGICQAGILEWDAISFSGGWGGDLSNLGIEPAPPALASGFFTTALPGKPFIVMDGL